MSQTVKQRKRGSARLSRKNQVTLPVAALHAAHVAPGDTFHVQVRGDGEILLVRDHDPLDEFIGSVPGLSAATNLQELRDEWER